MSDQVPDGVETVDLHAHALAPAVMGLVSDQPGHLAQQDQDRRFFGAASSAVNGAQLGRIGPLLTDPARRLAAMDAAGVDRQLVSPMPLYHSWADEPLAERITRLTNAGVAELVATNPGRLTGLGTVPLQHPELAAAELDHAVSELGLAGVQIGTAYGDRELADDAYAGFWARAEELGCVVFVHPWGCSLGERLDRHYLANTVGNPTETTVALSHLIFSGLLDRHPGLRLLAAHGGGYLPTYIGRSDHAWAARPDAHACAEPPSAYLRRIWFDSLVYTPQALRQLVEAVGAAQVVLGSDYPFDMGVEDPVDRLLAAGLDAADEVAVRGGNAARLLQRSTVGAR
ncbi:amidohydrolase family protein [uncultured Friedmanniella sp.]|uniref:amidohydrolase family protein n=1 Tax=uncultured Friedmanniella sp. TaxID=335381 RepID=UPI0035C96082